MKNLAAALSVELIKTRKSKILPATLLVFAFIPLMMGLMMFVARNPEIAAKLGMIGTKAKLFGENDWTGYFALLSQMIASIGLIGSGFVTAWVFSREHSDRTLKDILALPVPRSSIASAKLLVVMGWFLLLALILYGVGVSLGLLMHLPGWSQQLFLEFTGRYLVTSLLTLLLSSLVAFLSGYSGGIVAPLGFVILTMIAAQFAGLIGLGPYFPWAIPGLFSVAVDAPGFRVQAASYGILAVTFVLGWWATLRWWNQADHC
ncbi:MAG: ABC transporter permease [Bacteroidales bacterium]|nr:ABC transporter permease [Bacteroidales bacterium]